MPRRPERSVVREPAEKRFKKELSALHAADVAAKPPGWQLSPKAVCTFILGSDEKPVGEGKGVVIARKFYGDDPLVERCVVTLMGNRGLILIGEPGTAKTMLSELLAAAICGNSTNTIQGTAGTTEDQIKYSWNYALLLADGPGPKALVPSPLFIGLRDGLIVRFEEMTRCPQEIQDSLVSILSDKMMHVPELGHVESLVLARKGFNIIATANTRDRGVNEMSSALKRRFNFETVHPISDREFEVRLVSEQVETLLADAGAKAEVDRDVINLLVTAFQDLRNGRTAEGTVVDRPTTPMSTAEAVSVAFSAGLDACYFGDGRIRGEHVVRQLMGTVIKDAPEDARKIRQYFDVVVKSRLRMGSGWKSFYNARDLLET
ncbi:MAG: AAA family ATPase [Planctomycetes bacterium DG_58]|nr:MAG: AAA family ATPase [Planctomycetes bacterium DG_58]KPL04897.1 MAG: AAA family ATPase [Planctomycetes bacterium SM23_65]